MTEIRGARLRITQILEAYFSVEMSPLSEENPHIGEIQTKGKGGRPTVDGLQLD